MMHNLTKKRKPNNTRKTRNRHSVNFSKDAVYKQHVYDKNAFIKILAYTNKIKSSDMILDPKASGRLMYVINNTHPIVAVICSNEFINQVRKITGNKNLKPNMDIPIEYRKYVVGSHMHWHKDTQMLPDQLQYECVITLTNNSDSSTLLKYENGVKKISTQPNSLLIVRAKGITHKVTPLAKGERTILKIVFSE